MFISGENIRLIVDYFAFYSQDQQNWLFSGSHANDKTLDVFIEI